MSVEAVRAILEACRADALKRLCDLQQIDGGRHNGFRRSRLAAEYASDVHSLLDDMRKSDIVEYLDTVILERDGRAYELGYLNKASKEELVEVVTALTVEQWLPEQAGDGPVEGGVVRVYEIDVDDDVDEEDQAWEDELSAEDTLTDALPEYEVVRPAEVHPDARPDVELADFQKQAIDALRQHFVVGDGNRGLLCLPTGGGKTRTSLDWLLRDFVARGRRVLWITHRLDLLDQVHEDIRGLGFVLRRTRDAFSISRYDGTRHDLSGDIVLASAMSVAKRRPSFADLSSENRRLGIVCYDEAHRAVSPMTRRALEKLTRKEGVPILGLTATPFRGGAHGQQELDDFFGDTPIHQRTFMELVALGFLASPRYQRQALSSTQSFTVSSSEVADAKRRGDLPPAVLSRLARHHQRNVEIVKNWTANAARFGKTIVFACDIDHAVKLSGVFRDHGVRAGYIHSGLSADERRRQLERFKSTNELDVLVNVGILTEGANVPDTRTVLLARPTMSESLYWQMIGRGARGPRTVPGKTHFIVIDCVDNFGRHGLTLAGRRVAEELAIEPADVRSHRPTERAKPSSDVEASFASLAAWLLSRGFDPREYTLWGALRWTMPDGGDKSIAVFQESLPQLESALQLLRYGISNGDCAAALAQKDELDRAGSIRGSDWQEVIADCRITRTPPELIPLAPVQPQHVEDDLAVAQLLRTLAGVVYSQPGHMAVAECQRVWNGEASVRRLFPTHAALYQEASRQMAEAAPAPAPVPPTNTILDDVVAIQMAVARSDGHVHESERIAMMHGTARLLRIDDMNVVARAVAEAEQRSPQLAPALARVRAALPWDARLTLLDWLFRCAWADGRLLAEELRTLTECAYALEIPHQVVEQRWHWFVQLGAANPSVAVNGYRTCRACGSTFPDYARYCSECGTSLEWMG